MSSGFGLMRTKLLQELGLGTRKWGRSKKKRSGTWVVGEKRERERGYTTGTEGERKVFWEL